MKNILEGLKSRLDNTEEWINNLKDRIVEIIQSEHKRKKRVGKKIA